jgi:hypothetical protein
VLQNGVLIVLFFIISGLPIFAQEATVSLSPSKSEIFIKPGLDYRLEFRMKNEGDPVVLTPSMRPFTSHSSSTGVIDILQKQEPVLGFSDEGENLDKPLFLKTGDTLTIPLRIHIPEGAPEGDYYEAFIADTYPAPGAEGTPSLGIASRLVSPLLITVTRGGGVDMLPKINFFNPVGYEHNLLINKVRFVDSLDSIPLALSVSNNGNHYVKIAGKLTTQGWFMGKKSYTIMPQTILSGTNQYMSTESGSTFSPTRPILANLKGFLLGAYTAVVSIDVNGGASTMYANTTIVALPFKLIALILGIAGVIILFLGKRMKKSEAPHSKS